MYFNSTDSEPHVLEILRQLRIQRHTLWIDHRHLQAGLKVASNVGAGVSELTLETAS
jgi:hypothetical protein